MLRIKEILKSKGLTAKELAGLLGISESSLSQTIKAGANPSLQTLDKIAYALGVSAAELFEAPAQDSATITCPHCGKPITLKAE